MSVTSVWVPVSSAIAALLGGGIGAMLQGRYGVTGWRRQARLEAYVNFVNATHEFHTYLLDALDAADSPDFNDKWRKVREADWQMRRAGSVTSIAGPQSIERMAVEVLRNSSLIMKDGRSGSIPALARLRKNDVDYKHHIDWMVSAEDFAKAARIVLNTQGRVRRWHLFERAPRDVLVKLRSSEETGKATH